MKVCIQNYFILFYIFLMGSCTTQKFNRGVLHDIQALEEKHRNHLGFQVYDIGSQKNIIAYKGNKLFVPASNMKILTLYSAFENLGDSLATFKYSNTNGTLCIKGQADPTLLHPNFDNKKALVFFKDAENIVFDSTNFMGPSYAPGWAWEDYADYYQAEISPLPVFGNVVWLNYKNFNTNVLPMYFAKNLLDNSAKKIWREQRGNQFYKISTSESQVPFITSARLNSEILGFEIGKKISLGTCGNTKDLKTFYSNKADTTYRKMMFESDNTLAEHLLIQASQKYTDTLSTTLAIKKIRANLFPDLPIRWVDGAGLSRYNLISPESLVSILNLMQEHQGFENVIGFFPQAGVAGTLKSTSKTTLPIFAKSGSMGGIYNQSGYIISKKGKKLIFSFMSNNTLGSISAIKNDMMDILKEIIEKN
jgi:serine-type D-Ala-D-Ala carboxypeptidase/endopeptidase (penicillin-binding protein 4)